ncbi:MAG: glycosyltransferase family 2 protein [Lachnospiraceae bacterium]|nr:glycosyltransferase family 2 protein [Lachnospiraceae bacterium]
MEGEISKKGLVSIIIPVYNVEKYIPKCIESVISQDYKKIEIVVIDDGSTDKSIEIVKNTNDERIHIIHKVNGGQSSARNEGLKYCSGEYVFFLDSDDWLEPNAISNLMKEMDEGIDIVQGSLRRVYNDRVVDVRLKNEIICSDTVDEFFRKEKLYDVVWNKLYRKAIVENEFFYEGYINEDVIYIFHIACLNPRIKNIDTIVYNYLQRDGSTMHKKRLEDRIKVVQALNVVIEDCKKIERVHEQQALFDKYIALLYLYAYTHNGKLMYEKETFEYLVTELGETKKMIRINTIFNRVSRKQLLTLYLPSLISKNIVAKMFKMKERSN